MSISKYYGTAVRVIWIYLSLPGRMVALAFDVGSVCRSTVGWHVLVFVVVVVVWAANQMTDLF